MRKITFIVFLAVALNALSAHAQEKQFDWWPTDATPGPVKDEERGGYWWGASPIEVCRKPWQFSCWNETDPNRGKIESVSRDDRNFQSCLRIARRALAGTLKDPTNGATHYHAKGAAPPWAKNRKPSAEIGGHRFYNDVE